MWEAVKTKTRKTRVVKTEERRSEGSIGGKERRRRTEEKMER